MFHVGNGMLTVEGTGELFCCTLCLVLGFGGSNGQVRMAILAFSIRLGICGWLMSLSMMIPFTNLASSNRPPTLPSTCAHIPELMHKYHACGFDTLQDPYATI